MLSNFDNEGFKTEVLVQEEPLVLEMYERIVHQVGLNNRWRMTSEEEHKVALILYEEGMSLKTGDVESAVERAFDKVVEQGDRDQYVDLFIQKGEIDQTRFDTKIKGSMVQYLIDRGTHFADDNGTDVASRIQKGDFDEHFFAAYDHALTTTSDQLDPLDNTQGKTITDGQLWDFTVRTFDDLEEKGIVAENILAAGGVDYIYELGERLGIFRLVDAVVLNWSSGAIDVVEGPAAGKLYNYWKRRDDRCTPEERGMLYRRVLNRGQAQVLSRMVVNEHFTKLWHNLMNEVVEYIDKSERVDDGISETSPVSRRGIYQATRELQYNLTEYCTGMAHMKARELYAQLMAGVGILSDPDIMAHYGGTRRKSMWTVIEQLSKAEFNTSPNVGAHRTLAVDGNKIFQWLANFNEGTVTHDPFLEFVWAAESYILTAASVGEEEDLGSEEDDDWGDDFESTDSDDDFDDF